VTQTKRRASDGVRWRPTAALATSCGASPTAATAAPEGRAIDHRPSSAARPGHSPRIRRHSRQSFARYSRATRPLEKSRVNSRPPDYRSSEARAAGENGDGQDRPREVEADIGEGHRRRRERRQLQEDLQPAPALHPRQGPQRRDAARLLHGPRPQRQGQLGLQVDPHAAVLLRERSQGADPRPHRPPIDPNKSGPRDHHSFGYHSTRLPSEIDLKRT
jgi:hypothetical protein